MRNKWVSCSTNGNLNFNSELLELDEELWDYVIVHELMHFFVPNHRGGPIPLDSQIQFDKWILAH
jgi:predicted metal-dependent hydrolase